MSDVADRVKKIVVEHLGVEEAKVSDSASFIDDLGDDSATSRGCLNSLLNSLYVLYLNCDNVIFK